MKIKTFLIISMGFLSTLFSCNSKKAVHSKSNRVLINDFTKQDKKNKIVHQKIYDEMTTFTYQDFEDLKSNGSYDKFEIGELLISSGKIVCTDPIYRALGYPQNWQVSKGKYPVNIYIGLNGDFEGRVAYAEIIFSTEEIDSWELSLIDESNLNDDFEKKLNGMYPVESGLSSFTDFETWKNYNNQVTNYQGKDEKSNFYKDVLGPLFKLNEGIPKSSRGEDWIHYNIDNGNIIMFGTGWGDGLYSRFVGFDKLRNPVKLITDFIQLSEDAQIGN